MDAGRTNDDLELGVKTGKVAARLRDPRLCRDWYCAGLLGKSPIPCWLIAE